VSISISTTIVGCRSSTPILPLRHGQCSDSDSDSDSNEEPTPLSLTSHLRSNIAVFVYAFLVRRMSASFLAACRMGS